MLPREQRDQDVLFTATRLLREAIDALPEETASSTASVDLALRRQREAAVQHRHARLRAIQALRKPK